MSDSTPLHVSSYLDFLPALFRAADEHGEHFIGKFLLAFEHILSGLGDAAVPGFPPGLAEQLDGTARTAGAQRYFDPGPYPQEQAQRQAPLEFLDWLAGWVALSLREDWTEDEKRRFISRIVPLYRKRGTAESMIELLRIYTDDQPVTIYEFVELPHYFQVEMSLGLSLSAHEFSERQQRRQRIAMAIIDQEKPAHTFYSFKFRDIPTMQIGTHSTVGIDTVLGSVADTAGTKAQ